MRADRLLAILLLLQTRGKITAEDLAEEMEVSVRTIYRDMVALSTAGVPVYTERGPGGGCMLLDDYQTQLTGLTTDEVRAISMLQIPQALEELGVSQHLKAALIKLAAGLPSISQAELARAQQRVLIEADYEGKLTRSGSNQLRDLQKAIWQQVRVDISCVLEFGTPFSRQVEPLGLVAWENRWYLIWQEGVERGVYPLEQIDSVWLQEQTFERPKDFDLTAFWEQWLLRYRENQSYYLARLRVSKAIYQQLSRRFPVEVLFTRGNDQRVILVRFRDFYQARTAVLGCGGEAEVLIPDPLRESVEDFARQVIHLYR